LKKHIRLPTSHFHLDLTIDASLASPYRNDLFLDEFCWNIAAIMPEHNIVVFAGDHCGPEVITEAIKVIKTVEELRPTAGKFNLQDHLLGGCSIDKTGSPLTDEALAAAKASHAVLLGAIGGPKWGTGTVRPEQGLLKLRSEMAAYGNLRPCFFASDALVEYSPLKADICRGTDMMLVRELTLGLYFGERKEYDGTCSRW